MNTDERIEVITETITEAILEHLENDNYGELKLKRTSTPESIATAIVSALAEPMTVEYAGHHKYAGIQTLDEDHEPFDNEEQLRDNFADFDNCTLMSRRVTPWTALEDPK